MWWTTLALAGPFERSVDLPDSEVWVELGCGTVVIRGTTQPGVKVSGDEGAGLEVCTESGVRVRQLLEGPEHCVQLLVEVPRNADVEVSTASAAVVGEGLTGDVSLSSASGDVSFTGAASSLHAETVSGALTVSGRSRRAEVSTISGALSVRDSAGRLDASSVSGDITLDARQWSALEVETVSGSVRASGGLVPGASVELATHSGSVVLSLPAGTRLELELTSFSGERRSAFPSTPTPGPPPARVEVSTFSGDITVEASAAGAPPEPPPPPSPPPRAELPPLPPPVPSAPPRRDRTRR